MKRGSIGTTGSRKTPIKNSQLSELMSWLKQNKESIKEAHHGDCVGWDIAFHRAIVKTSDEITIHISPTKESKTTGICKYVCKR